MFFSVTLWMMNIILLNGLGYAISKSIEKDIIQYFNSFKFQKSFLKRDDKEKKIEYKMIIMIKGWNRGWKIDINVNNFSSFHPLLCAKKKAATEKRWIFSAIFFNNFFDHSSHSHHNLDRINFYASNIFLASLVSFCLTPDAPTSHVLLTHHQTHQISLISLRKKFVVAEKINDDISKNYLNIMNDMYAFHNVR